jgi:hypothetical protein
MTRIRFQLTGFWLLGLLGFLTTSLPGCSLGIGVHAAKSPPVIESWRTSFVNGGDLSPPSWQTLRSLDLADYYRQHPAEVHAELHQLAARDPEPDFLFALAEMSYLLGRQREKEGDHQACAYYYLCAGYAYHYLFPAGPRPASAATASTFDPRYRLACDLYNSGLAKCIRAAQHIGKLDPRRQLALHCPHGQTFTLSVVHHGFAWKPEEFGPLLFCSDFEVVGLDSHYRHYGLGVPLIAVRVAPAKDAAPSGAFYPREVSFPVTAFFRFQGSVADLGSQRSGQLELFNPLEAQNTEIDGRVVPLETDLTTPLAYYLSHTDLDVGLTGFLRVDQLKSRTGIYMFEPYQPGKIPVLMVHGLLSSPLTWTPMFNDLRADPELRKHYQFWFYLYPTGNPYLESAADLRQELARLRSELDPQHRDTALDQMVFVGHSMGGLVSKLLTVDSSNDFWRQLSAEPFEQVKAPPKVREEIQRVFFFREEPCIKRVVFLGTPHHGSNLSPSPLGQLGARLVQLPRNMVWAARDLVKENPGLKTEGGMGSLSSGRLPTSIDLLAPGAPALEVLAARPTPAGVHYHSIIGVAYGKVPDGGDGIVPYASAHLDHVDSELVVPADHTHVHNHPRAVLEVRRILEEHLQQVLAQQAAAGH